MEVTHREDHVTHAVITSHKAMDVQVSDDASFLHTLSATLYSDQKGAVVREVLCNAWDSHKSAGRTNVPVEVTINHESMSFKDNGFGIPPGQEMLTIYGTYGKSTKRNDGLLTGGFGLGSKAPWAYADQFTVISSHKGTRSIYNLSKSSAEVGGKPSIIPIASFPTEEEGLTVTIPIKGADFHTFKSLVAKFALYGDMNVRLNGTLLERYPFNSETGTFALMQIGDIFNSNVLVRYGDVIYPLIDAHESFTDELAKARAYIKKLGYRWSLILLAKPNTISVTPSRESLSMQTHTAATLKALLRSFLYGVAQSPEIKLLPKKLLVEGIKEIAETKKIPGLMAFNKMIPIKETLVELVKHDRFLSDPVSINKLMLKSHYPESKDFQNLDIETRLQHLIKQGIGNAGLIKTFMNLWESQKNSQDQDTEFLAVSEWFQKRVVGQVTRKINKSSLLSKKRLTVVAHNTEYPGSQSRKWESNHKHRYGTTTAHCAGPMTVTEYIPYLRNIVVLSFTRNNVHDLLVSNKDFRDKYGAGGKFLCYVVQRSKKVVDEARKQFKTLNAVFVDLTEGVDLNPVPKEPKPKVDKPKKKPGFPLLSNAFVTLPNKRQEIDMTRLRLPDALYTTKPEFYVHITNAQLNENHKRLYRYGIGRKYGEEILQLFGSRGVRVVTQLQADKLKAQGVPDMDGFLVAEITKEITANPIYATYAANKHHNHSRTFLKDSDQVQGMQSILSHLPLRKEFNVNVELTETQKMYLRLALDMINGCEDVSEVDPEVVPIFNVLVKTPISKELMKLMKMMQSSTMIRWVNVSEVADTISSRDPMKAGIAMSLLKYALKS